MEADETDIMAKLPVIGYTTYREAHAFTNGFYCGVVGEKSNRYYKEVHYWRMGWLIGDLYDRMIRD